MARTKLRTGVCISVGAGVAAAIAGYGQFTGWKPLTDKSVDRQAAIATFDARIEEINTVEENCRVGCLVLHMPGSDSYSISGAKACTRNCEQDADALRATALTESQIKLDKLAETKSDLSVIERLGWAAFAALFAGATAALLAIGYLNRRLRPQREAT